MFDAGLLAPFEMCIQLEVKVACLQVAILFLIFMLYVGIQEMFFKSITRTM